MASEIKVNTIKDLGGNTVLTSNGSGTISGLPASAISSGTVATARLGSGTASSSTFLAGDSSYKTVSGTTINNNADNRVITGSGTANTLEGESTLTYDGTNLDLPDNKKIRLGTGNDLEVYHDANNSYLKNNINSLISLSAGHYWRNVNDDSGTGMCIVSSKVGIGEETPLGKLHVKTADTGASVHANADELVIEGTRSGLTILCATEDEGSIYFGDSGDNDQGQIVYNQQVSYMKFVVNAAERMRINNNGTIAVGHTGSTGSSITGAGANGVYLSPTASNGANCIAMSGDQPLTINRSDANNNSLHLLGFHRNGSTCGNITGTNSATSYNTSSDYRLKENVDYNFDATTRLKQLKPARFNFIADETNTLVDGFLAHEVSNIVPEAISGTKDAMHPEVLYADKVLYTAEDELPEGINIGDTKTPADELPKGKNFGDVKEVAKPNHQGIDQSKLVPLLVKTIQELEARIKTLEDA
jgi:hypothetical protein